MDVDWIAVAGVVLALVALGLELVRMRRDGRRFVAAEGRLDAAEGRLEAEERINALLQLRAALAQAETAALKHLFIPGVSGAPRDLQALLDEARFLAQRVTWSDVSEASARVLDECERVTEARQGQVEEKNPLAARIEQAMKAADDAIGARIDSLRRRS